MTATVCHFKLQLFDKLNPYWRQNGVEVPLKKSTI